MKSFYNKFKGQFIIFMIFLSSALLIILLHLLLHPIRLLGMDTSIFYMDEKYTLAAFFTTTTSFLVGFLALVKFLSTQTGLKNKILNFSYALFFIILAFDEYFEIHEYVNTLIKLSLDKNSLIGSLVNFSWIFPLLLIIVFVFFMFLLKIKKSEKEVGKILILGCISFAVVLVFELFGSATYGENIYLYFVAIEEGAEMIGITFFLLAGLIDK